MAGAVDVGPLPAAPLDTGPDVDATATGGAAGVTDDAGDASSDPGATGPAMTAESTARALTGV